jgi:hypothetical protein
LELRSQTLQKLQLALYRRGKRSKLVVLESIVILTNFNSYNF